MNAVTILEIMMLLLFGCSWPFNIRKSLVSKTTLGKSIGFEILIITGYFCGVAAKLITYGETGNLPYSFWFYLLDIALVGTDICIYFRNLKLDKQNGRIK